MSGPLPQFSFNSELSLPASDTASSGREVLEYGLPQNCINGPNFPMLIHATENHELCVGRRFHEIQASFNTSALVSVQETRPWNQPASHTSSAPFSPLVVHERDGDYAISPSFSAHGPDQDITHWDSHLAFDPPGTWLPAPDQQTLTPFVEHHHSSWHQFLDQASAHPLPACPSHETYLCSSNDKTAQGSLILDYIPQYQSFSPIPPGLSPASTGFVEVEACSIPALHRAPHRDSAGSVHRRHAARAIEYDGLWIDEEELLKGFTKPGEKLSVHQCYWEEDCSPCHLWIRGNKSSINMHIQKWHGGRPGGDKVQVQCRWSACGKMMLKESIGRHIVSVHLGEVWECQGCGKWISRNDAYEQHTVTSDLEACQTSGALVTYFAGAREINARAALGSGGRVRYTGA